MKPRATLVCCYNKKEIYEDLVKSLSSQTEPVELIAIDNSKSKFSSCSKAFNSILASVSTQFIIFSHQDIWFEENDCITRFLDYCEEINECDIIGVAGRRKSINYGLSNIKQGKNREWAVHGRVERIQECDTIDECFFGGYTSCFKKYSFDEKICNGWHLYAVDRCLAALSRDNKVYVCDVPLVHISSGKTDHAFNICLYKLCLAYKNRLNYIAAPCEQTSTKPIMRELSYLKRELHVLKRDWKNFRKRRDYE